MSQFKPSTSSMRLAGSFKLTPTFWTKSQITFDNSTGTLSITGHSLVIGDKVIIVNQTGRASDISTGALWVGKTYYVRQVSGNLFRLSTDNTDTNLISVPATLGASVEWRLEKITDINTITINNLNIKNNARVIIRNGGLVSAFTAIQFTINGVEDANAYYYVHAAAQGIGNRLYMYHAGSNTPIKFRAFIDLICKDNFIIANGEFGFDGAIAANGSATTGITTGSIAETKVDSRFDKINSISLNTGSGSFIGDFTMEVYEL